MPPSIRITAAEMESTFLAIALRSGVPENKARTCARIFTENTLAGVLSGGATTRDLAGNESRVSQVFVAFDVDRFGGAELRRRIVSHVLDQRFRDLPPP